MNTGEFAARVPGVESTFVWLTVHTIGVLMGLIALLIGVGAWLLLGRRGPALLIGVVVGAALALMPFIFSYHRYSDPLPGLQGTSPTRNCKVEKCG